MTSKLLLDTWAAIWVVEGEPLSESAVQAISQAVERAVPVLISPITAWERGLLAAKGRIAFPLTPKRWFDVLLSQPGLELAELSLDILVDSSFLPGLPPGDPADRIIVATARSFDLTIVTRDKAMLDYAAQGHVRALAC